jgi:hypothetical protein
MKNDLNLADIKFTFRCQKKWDDLERTDRHDVRLCNECNYHVHSIVDRLDLRKLDLGGECFSVKISQPDQESTTILGGAKKSLPVYPPIQTFLFSCGYISNLSEVQLSTIKSLRHLNAMLNMKNKKIKFTIRLSQLEELNRIIDILEKDNIIYSIE